MSEKYFLDTNIFIRYLTNDDPKKADRVENFIKSAIKGNIILITNIIVIAELVWTLESYYKLSKQKISEMISLLLNTPNLELKGKNRILNALSLYVEKNMDFADAYNAYFMKESGILNVMTYDKKHFNRIEWINRIEP